MNEQLAVVVGGTGQIGQHLICKLICNSYHVISISGHLPTQRISGVEYMAFDMSSQSSVEICYNKIKKNHSNVDLLVNAIGKNNRRSLRDIDEAIWDDVINSNLKSVFFICKTFYNLLLDGGCIVNFSSTAGIRAIPQSPHYIAAKAGVIALTKYFAQVFAPDIRVNCIAPGFAATKNHESGSYTGYEKTMSKIPLHKMASLDEIAETVLYFARSETITGHTIVIDGGLTL